MSAMFDLSELDTLIDLLEESGDEATKRSHRMVDTNTRIVESAARSNAQARADTGELAASVESEVNGFFGKVSADPRQGWFLEYGSPNTGAPDPWMSAPAERAQDAMLETLAKEFGPW